jgi:hypothetical protein
MLTGPWKVTVRWVFDSEKYNEWMNPVDFETEEALAEQERLGLVIEPGAYFSWCCDHVGTLTICHQVQLLTALDALFLNA